ncbi:MULTISPECIES: Ada metal-binding domain-containing protein [unclassified Variovorax]|jgi:AraC family transcriptional regulator of adaptative response / DNA-3-methyladenine glycosylase II|uniref:DNA-3-methyladenine glycosylase 2 family protein n=1 Tax=unclassified Variovorax TaxID=663243 RepID=UPI000F7F9CD7|nr:MULTISPECIES: Ada metal-binding domain-containing protein [unclassified Variovorax]RSZ36041.1 DNA-3-methyladenine glycosylase 2 family protein [Variovorax sp. 553]RSZ36801.1 DNA-3-methyladenine glycosylase 2 family protein [Variovorax sp. 679]
MPANHTSSEALQSDACYLAMKTHDARFDGSFFTAVTSTGIYCRPVCRVKLPRRENCRFFRHAAQAEAAGFRPCLRCRPELAPRAASWSTEDASRILALQAARLIDEPDAWSEDGPGAAQIAARLGVSDRHLRRIFEVQFGVSPLQYLQTRRLLAAKQLIADTRLPMTQVALASGFASVRRFNAAFLEHYGLNPSALRRAGGGSASGEDKAIEVRLGFRPPYDANAMLGFFARRALRGVEVVSTADGKEPAKGSTPVYTKLTRTLRIQHGGQAHAGWLQLRFDLEREQMLLSVSDSLAAVLPIVISRARALFDLDAEPMAINAALHAAFPHGDGLRVPGAVDGFELAVRAVLGQQITVAAARTLGSRLVEAFGEPLATPVEGLNRLFPTPAAIAAASGDELGRLGIVRQRQTALHAIASEVAAGKLALHAGADVPSTIAALQELPGIGAWTAQYIAMRALRWPDAFPAGDVALQKALGVTTARAASEASLAWQPWRSYAVLRAWHAPAAASSPSSSPPASDAGSLPITTAGVAA